MKTPVSQRGAVWGRAFLIGGGLVWAIALAGGMFLLMRYAAKPGESANPPQAWPAQSKVPRTDGRATLVMFAHPKCPCTRASISELEALMTHCQKRVSAFVLFVADCNAPSDWSRTDLWDSAAAIPGVQVLRDDGGDEAARFHAATSGQTVLYGANGNLLFHGGITSARGHAGDNFGVESIVSLVNAKAADRTETPVFGCSLERCQPLNSRGAAP